VFRLGLHVVLVSCLALGGCGHFRRVAECRRLADHVNGALDEIAATQDAGGVTAASYRDIADRYDKLGSDVLSFAHEDDSLGRALKEYGAFYKDTARTLRLLADVTEHRDLVAAVRVRRDAGNMMRRDRSLAARVDALCSEP
jgi:hypothetical protein